MTYSTLQNAVEVVGAIPTTTALTLSLDTIRQLDGLYCLNDLHRLSGNDPKHKPANFIRKDTTQGLIQALESQNLKMRSEPHFSYTRSETDNSEMRSEVYFSINGGSDKGSYGCRELVYAYAMWIDPYFYALVLKVFDRVSQHATSYTAKINQLVGELNAITQCLSMAGRVLCVEGKQTKPAMKQALHELLDNQQLKLQGV